MLNGLKQVEIEMELRNPEIRGIIQAYSNAENARVYEAVYFPLGKRYPSLNGILEEMRKGYDPIARMEETKSQIQTLREVKGLVGLLNLVGEDKDTQAVKTMLDKLDPFSELYEKSASIEEQFYVNLAHAVKSISTQNAISVDETVRNLQYMDTVSRIVFPTREEAESYLRTSQLYGREMLDVTRGFIAFVKKTVKADEEMLKKAKLLPTAEAMEVIQRATWDYEMQEFDRVYSR